MKFGRAPTTCRMFTDVLFLFESYGFLILERSRRPSLGTISRVAGCLLPVETGRLSSKSSMVFIQPGPLANADFLDPELQFLTLCNFLHNTYYEGVLALHSWH